MPLTLRVRQVVALVAVDREAQLALVAVKGVLLGTRVSVEYVLVVAGLTLNE